MRRRRRRRKKKGHSKDNNVRILFQGEDLRWSIFNIRKTALQRTYLRRELSFRIRYRSKFWKKLFSVYFGDGDLFTINSFRIVCGKGTREEIYWRRIPTRSKSWNSFGNWSCYVLGGENCCEKSQPKANTTHFFDRRILKIVCYLRGENSIYVVWEDWLISAVCIIISAVY